MSNIKIDDVIARLAAIREELERLFTVKRIGVFGSVARGEPEQGSDIDIVVDLAEPTFDHYMDLKFRIEDELGLTVDLVLEDAIKPRIRPYIHAEVIYA